MKSLSKSQSVRAHALLSVCGGCLPCSLFSINAGGHHVNLPVLLFIYFVRFASLHSVHAVRQFLLRLSLNKFTKQQFRPVHTTHSHGSVDPRSGLFTGDFLAVLWFHGSQALSGGEELWDLETRPGLAVCFSVCSLKSELLEGRVSLRFCSLLPWWQIVALNGPYWELPEATSCFQFCCLGSWDFLFHWFTNLACDVGCSFFQQLNVLAPLLAPLSIQHSLFLLMTKCPTVYCFLNPLWPLLASQFFLEFWLTFAFRSIDT